MISEAIKAIEADLTALPWVSRYGGIVKVASRYVEGNENEGHMEYFPISCNVSGTDCWDDGRYLDLVPNDELASIVYFEEVNGLQPAQLEGRRRQRRISVLTGQLRFVGWFNLPKLGLDVCDIHPYVIGDINRLFNRKIHNYDSGVIKFFEVILKLDHIEPKTVNPFDGYSYYEKEGLMLYPFDFISAVVNITIRYNENCLPTLTPEDEIECETY